MEFLFFPKSLFFICLLYYALKEIKNIQNKHYLTTSLLHNSVNNVFFCTIQLS